MTNRTRIKIGGEGKKKKRKWSKGRNEKIEEKEYTTKRRKKETK
jgi:hypothetical protein